MADIKPSTRPPSPVVSIDQSQIVYRLFGIDGGLLYVGVTIDPGARFMAHRRTAHWWSEVAQITLQRFATRDAAMRAENQAIANEAPLHNRMGRMPGAGPRPVETYVPHGPMRNRIIRIPDDLWEGLADSVGDRYRGQVIREYIAWYLRRPGAELPQRSMRVDLNSKP